MNVRHNITTKYSLNEKPIVNQKQRLNCTIKAYSSVYTFTTYFINNKKKKKEKKIENRQDRVKRNNDSPSDKLVFATDNAKAHA